jgi:hypothetical protein
MLPASFSIMALADAPKLRSRSCRGFPAVLPAEYSSDQILVSQPLACRRIDEASEPMGRVPRHVTLIEVECKLVNVQPQMLVAGVAKLP